LQKLNNNVSTVKEIFSFIFGFGWGIGKLEIRERQARYVNNPSEQYELKGDVIKVISHSQHLGTTFPNIFCPRYKIVKLDSKFKSNVGYHGFH
jgi:hypothetical protein